MTENLEQTRKSYDLVAEEYVRRLYHELENMPLDCEVLECFAAAVRDQGLVCEIGCGPGQVARYLHERGVAAVGFDLSPRMVELARQLHPGIEFQEGIWRSWKLRTRPGPGSSPSIRSFAFPVQRSPLS
jgi:SAM-dependent methyltransferase